MTCEKPLSLSNSKIVVQENHQQKYLWVLLGLSIVLLFPGLGKTPLWIYDEVRNAECAREMYERGDWIVPTFNGGLRTLKPPLHYYFMFGGFKIFGITEWGARFFSAVFGLFTILITYFFVKKYATQKQAFITCLVLLASGHFLFEFRMAVPDPYLIFLNTASVFTAYTFFREKKFNGKRVLFLLYEEHKCIFLVTITNKKAQQHEIDLIKANLDIYREELENLLKGLKFLLFFL